MSQYELAERLGITQSTVSVFKNDEATDKKSSKPGPATWLALAGVSRQLIEKGVCSEKDVDYCLIQSGIPDQVLNTIRDGLGVEAKPDKLSAKERRLLAFYRSEKLDTMRAGIRDVIKSIVESSEEF